MRAALGLLLLGACAAPASSDRFRRATAEVTVSGIPRDSVPVSVHVDLTALAGGPVDERTIRLVGPGGEVPVQFHPDRQARVKPRRLLPGTNPAVSGAAEFRPAEVPVPVAGTLSWIAEGPGTYRLEAGVPRDGSFMQVPYPPNNLRGFDSGGRPTPVRRFPRMQIRPLWPLEGKLHVLESGRRIMTYHVGPRPGSDPKAPGSRRPFFHPVNGPDGTSLTEFGKPHDPTGSHAHHYGLWIAHMDVGGRNFWSEKGGVIAHDALELLEDGPVYCRIVQRTRWMAGGEDVLKGRRSWTVWRETGGFRLVDLDLRVEPAGKEPVPLGKTTFGFLAVRVAQSMTVFDGAGEIRNARGAVNENGVHRSNAGWLDQSGPVSEGAWGGIAVLDHPDNPHHPTGWHCRNDGWAGAAFNKDAAAVLEPGKPLRLRYRLVLHRGDASSIPARYAAYAARPRVEVAR